MIHIQTKKDDADGLHYVISWSAVPASKVPSDPLPNNFYFPNDKIPENFFKNYLKYFIDSNYIRLHPNK